VNRIDERAFLILDTLNTMEPYVGPGELEKLAEWLATAGDDDIWITWRRSIRAAEMLKRMVEPMHVGRQVLPAASDEDEIGFTICEGDYEPRARHDDRCQDQSMSCCERLRTLEAALDCSHMDISLKDEAFVDERADHLADRLRRRTDIPSIDQVMLVYSECNRH